MADLGNVLESHPRVKVPDDGNCGADLQIPAVGRMVVAGGIAQAPAPGSMSKPISEIASTLKHLGDIQVTDVDYTELLHKDIRDLEISRSLRRLGRIRVTDWEFKDVFPAVNKLAHQEVDLVDLLKRTASYKVMEWDFRKHPEVEMTARPDAAAMQRLILRLKSFLGYVAANLIEEPGHAQIKVAEIAPGVLRFRLVMVKRDVAILIGTEGHSAAALRSLLKAAAGMHGVHALLEILSHEEEAAIRDS